MATGDHEAATLRRYSDAQARLEHAGGWAWRDRAASIVRGLGFADGDLDRQLDTFSGGELTRASLARALSGTPTCSCSTSRRTISTSQSLEWLERELHLARRRGDSRRARPLVPRGGDDCGARARGAEALLLRRPVARLAPGEGGARLRGRDAARPG